MLLITAFLMLPVRDPIKYSNDKLLIVAMVEIKSKIIAIKIDVLPNLFNNR